MKKKSIAVILRNKEDNDIIDILIFIKLRLRMSYSEVVRSLLREWRDNGYVMRDQNPEDVEIFD
jgi:hypothetical protein